MLLVTILYRYFAERTTISNKQTKIYLVWSNRQVSVTIMIMIKEINYFLFGGRYFFFF